MKKLFLFTFLMYSTSIISQNNHLDVIGLGERSEQNECLEKTENDDSSYTVTVPFYLILRNIALFTNFSISIFDNNWNEISEGESNVSWMAFQPYDEINSIFHENESETKITLCENEYFIFNDEIKINLPNGLCENIKRKVDIPVQFCLNNGGVIPNSSEINNYLDDCLLDEHVISIQNENQICIEGVISVCCTSFIKEENQISNRSSLRIEMNNPILDFLLINADIKNYKLNIFDASGKLILAQNVLNYQSKLDFTRYKTGVYYLMFVKENEIFKSQKIIKI